MLLTHLTAHSPLTDAVKLSPFTDAVPLTTLEEPGSVLDMRLCVGVLALQRQRQELSTFDHPLEAHRPW